MVVLVCGVWNAGHGNELIANAIGEQAKKLDYAPFFNMSHDIGFQAAERLVEMAPKGFDKVFFTNSGSESADTSLKIALAYHAARGENGRIKFIGREKVPSWCELRWHFCGWHRR